MNISAVQNRSFPGSYPKISASKNTTINKTSKTNADEKKQMLQNQKVFLGLISETLLQMQSVLLLVEKQLRVLCQQLNLLTKR